MKEDIVKRLAIAKAFIDERLEDEFAWEEAAEVAGFSPFHFHRLFRSWLGLTLTAYVRERRLMRAAEAVRCSEAKLIDIGLANGFEGLETFSRVFKRKYGLTPGEYRKRRRGGMNDMKVQIIELRDTRVVGVSVRTDVTKDRKISEAWKQFSLLCMKIPNVKENAIAFGLEIYQEAMKGIRTGEFTYVACIEVDGNGVIPEGTIAIEIPGGRYAVATHQGSTERLQETFGHLYGEWLPSSGDTLRHWVVEGGTRAFDFEAYDGRYSEGDPMSELDVYIPLRG